MSLSKLGHNLAGIVLGQLVGIVSEELTNRLRIHRGELGGPLSGPGSGKMETLLDLSLDTFIQLIFITLGITLSTKAMPAITTELDTLIFYIMGLSTQTTFPKRLHKLTTALRKDQDTILMPVPSEEKTT
jgi:hypothetical protein